MSEIGDRLRHLFDEIAPRPDVRGLLRRPIEEPRPVRSWAIAVAGVTAVLGITLFVLVTLGQDQRPPVVVTTLPGTTIVSTTVPDTTATTAVGDDPIASLAPRSVECRLIDQALTVFPCAEVTDFDDSTAVLVHWEGGFPSFTMTFDEPVTVHALRLRNLTDPSGFLRRARIQGVEVTSETGASAVVAFADENTEQVLSLEPAAVSGREITVSATALYPPQSFEDQPPILEFALAELTLIGRTTASEMVLDAWVGEWSPVTVDPARRGIAQAIAFNGESFALITRMEGGDIVVWESADGLEWVVVGELDIEAPFGLSFSSRGGGWVVAGVSDGRATVWPSWMGWDPVTVDEDPDSPGSAITSIVEWQGRLVAVGGYGILEGGDLQPAVWVSDDGGASWVPVGISEAMPLMMHDVVVGPAGLLGTARSSSDFGTRSEVVLYRSIDGLTWERITPIGLAARQVDRVFADRDGTSCLTRRPAGSGPRPTGFAGRCRNCRPVPGPGRLLRTLSTSGDIADHWYSQGPSRTTNRTVSTLSHPSRCHRPMAGGP